MKLLTINSLLLIFMLSATSMMAQTKNDKKVEMTVVDVQPSFKGGQSAWVKFMRKNLKYPADATQKGIEGPVFLRFLVTEKGEIKDVEELRSPAPSLTKAAMKMLSKSPKWKPALLKGKKVECIMQIQVMFKLK